MLELVIGEGLKLVMCGVGLGLMGAWLATRVLQNMLFGVTATDPFIFMVNALILIVVALFACVIPARRGSKLDPMEALRYE